MMVSACRLVMCFSSPEDGDEHRTRSGSPWVFMMVFLITSHHLEMGVCIELVEKVHDGVGLQVVAGFLIT